MKTKEQWIDNMSFSSDSSPDFNSSLEYGTDAAINLNHQPCLGTVEVQKDGGLRVDIKLAGVVSGKEAYKALDGGFFYMMRWHGDFETASGGIFELRRHFSVKKESYKIEDTSEGHMCFIIKEPNKKTGKVMMFKLHGDKP